MPKLVYCFFFVLLLFVSGCTNIDLSSSLKTFAASDKKEPASITSTTNQRVTDIDIKKIHGKIQNIYYVNKNQILILADKLYLYNLLTGNIVSQTDKENLIEERYCVLNNGIAAIGFRTGGNTDRSGFVVDSESDAISCVLYDNKLNKEMEINSEELIGKDEFFDFPDTMSVSKDGKKIVFATNAGLYLYDINHKTKTTLVDLLDKDSSKRSGLVGFDQVEFVNDDKMVVFKSQSFDVPAVVGKLSFDTYGTMNIDGSGLNVRKSTDYQVKQLIAYNTFAFFAEDFTVPSGRLMIFDFSLGQSKLLKTKTQKESGNVLGSENGTFFATTGIESGNIMVRVYDTKSNSMLMEKEIVKEDKYMERDPQVRIFDDMRTCIVLLGNTQKELSTQYLIFSF